MFFCCRSEPSATIRRAIIVLPFVSMVTEKARHLQSIVAPYNRGRPRKQRIKARTCAAVAAEAATSASVGSLHQMHHNNRHGCHSCSYRSRDNEGSNVRYRFPILAWSATSVHEQGMCSNSNLTIHFCQLTRIRFDIRGDRWCSHRLELCTA